MRDDLHYTMTPGVVPSISKPFRKCFNQLVRWARGFEVIKPLLLTYSKDGLPLLSIDLAQVGAAANPDNVSIETFDGDEEEPVSPALSIKGWHDRGPETTTLNELLTQTSGETDVRDVLVRSDGIASDPAYVPFKTGSANRVIEVITGVSFETDEEQNKLVCKITKKKVKLVAECEAVADTTVDVASLAPHSLEHVSEDE